MKFRSALAWLFCLMLMLGSLAVAEGDVNAGLQRDLVVFFTSDVHCGVDQNFGYAGLQAVVDAARAKGDHVMLVDDGDSIQGEAIGLMSAGQANIELMNELPYDLAIPGNHEFDYGVDRFMELREMANFPYICCNFRKYGEPVLDPFTLREFDGVKIGFVGVLAPETLTGASARQFKDDQGNYIYDFMQGDDGRTLYAGVQKAVDDVRAEGAQYVILMGHLGNEAGQMPYTYADVLANTRGIDAMLDGHSHDTDRVVMKNADGQDVVRQACGTKMACIGWLRISADDGSIDTGLYTWPNNCSMPELLGLDNRMSRSVAKKNEVIQEGLNQSAGYMPVALTINDPVAVTGDGRPVRIIRNAETNMGDFVTDAIRDQTGADVAIIGAGAIHVGIPKGEITFGDVMRVLSDNQIAMVEVTGQQLLDALEFGARSVPTENGCFLQVSGLSYEIHTYIPSGCRMDSNHVLTGIEGERRVQNVLVGGEPLDVARTYTVGGTGYLLINGGRGFSCFDDVRVLTEDNGPDYMALAEYLAKHLNDGFGERYTDPYGEGRIVAVPQEPAE